MARGTGALAYRKRGSIIWALRRMLMLAFTALIIIVLIDPSDRITHLKVPVFCAVFLLWVAIRMCTGDAVRVGRIHILAFLVSIGIPLTSLLIGLLEDNSIDLNIAIGRAKSYLFFALLVVIIDEKIDLEEFAPLTGVVAVIMEVVFVVYLFSPHTFAELYQYTIEKDNMFISTRRDVGFGMFYYKTSATIVFVLALCFQRVEDGRHRMQNLLLACGCSFALLLSGARANLMGGFLICMCYCFRWLRRKVGYLAAYSVVTVVVVVSLSYVVNSWSSGSGNKESNDIKYAHLISYSNIFMDRPSLLLMGEGLGSAFRTKAAPNDSHVYDAELAYIEIVRELGLPMALVVIGAFIMPLYLIKKRGLLAARRNMVVAYTAYLLMAWSNPLLISSTGIMVLLCMYSVAYVQKGRDRFRPVLVARGVGV